MFDEVCPFCESDTPFELYGVVVESREIDGVFCCEGYRDAMGMILDGLDEEEWAGFWKEYFGKPEISGGIRAAYGLEVRSVINEPTCASTSSAPIARCAAASARVRAIRAWPTAPPAAPSPSARSSPAAERDDGVHQFVRFRLRRSTDRSTSLAAVEPPRTWVRAHS